MVKLIQPAPPILLLVVVRQLSRLSTVLQHHPLWKREVFMNCNFPRCSNSTGCYILHLVGQVSPVRARICGDQVDPLLLQRVQRLRHVVGQL